ncbi:MAG: phosphatase domain-containing protein [Leptospiraceae bacterium]|nr:phosphatase domain-containing protein [Leptospiraceae bacterium]
MENEKKTKPSEIRLKDKKRIAICGGSLGRENRLLVRGQLVDVGVPNYADADDVWDVLTGFFVGEEHQITPFKDFSLAPVRKPILAIEVFDTKEKKVFESSPFIGNSDGFFSCEIQKKLKAGKYFFHVIFKGSDSYRQYTQDIAYLNLNENSDITKSTIVGKGKIRILSEKYDSYLTTSDIDQTYLATEIGSGKGMFSTIFETPDEKFYLPGMPELYQVLRNDTEDSPLCFISASPHFFRRTMLATIHAHGIETESLHLKYLEGTVRGVLDKITSTLTRPDKLFREGLKPALDRTGKFFKSSYQSLFDQLSYKLTILLQDRLYQPTKCKEILLGDNTESDYLIFTLYQLILLGVLQGTELENFLYKLNFLGRDAVTRDNARKIADLAREITNIHGNKNSVFAVLINETSIGPNANQMRQNVYHAMPSSLNLLKLKNFTMFEPTSGALGFATILHALGVIEFDSLLTVLKSMLGKWFHGVVVDEKFLLKTAQAMNVPEYAQKHKDLIAGILTQCVAETEVGHPSLTKID